MTKTFDIVFDNYICDSEFEKMPSYKGVYLFRLTERKDNKLYPRVIYIGVAEGGDGLAGRVNNYHNKLNEARKLVKIEQSKGKDVFLTISYTNKNDEYNLYWNRIKAGLIFGRKPQLNDEYTKNFGYQKTTIIINGARHQDLKKKYTIESTSNN